MAAGTTTITYSRTFDLKSERRTVFAILCTSGSSSFTDVSLSTMLTANSNYTPAQVDVILTSIGGGSLFAVEYVPSATVPTSDPTVTFETASTSEIFNYAFTAATYEMVAGAEEKGMFVPIIDPIFTCTTLADTKIATINMWISH